MRILVLGGTRFIGRAAVEELAAAGHDLLLVHRGELEPDDMPPVEHLHTDREGLLAHRRELASFAGDAVLDCRALTRRDAEVALEAIPDAGRRVVISSIDVYRAFGALNANAETDPIPIDEDSPVRTSRYIFRGQVADRHDYDKLDVEDVYLPRGAVSLRLPMVYGEHDYQLREEFILRRVRAGRERIPFGGGMWLTCRVYVRDVARAVRRAIEMPELSGVFNICEDRTYSMRMWAQMILDAADSKAELVRVPDDALPPDMRLTGTVSQHIAATARKAREVLGWSTSDPFETLRTTVQWHLAHPPAGPDGDFAEDDEALAAV
ncbi:MAG TPA: NAD-dependent epimerase/dehydratase family protein [Candidatus Dormibacteraeota bacterium]|nr:NAD-dependent epimerase/dehydratase family protein [Candidatus Dormibacteraeota bacterium]